MGGKLVGSVQAQIQALIKAGDEKIGVKHEQVKQEAQTEMRNS